jgi:hypothetical protein
MASIEEIIEQETIEASRYQPLMAITQERLECDCGALAIFVLMIQDDSKEHNALILMCQSCFEIAKRVDE